MTLYQVALIVLALFLAGWSVFHTAFATLASNNLVQNLS
jgi:hypothetical protein